MLKAVRFDEEKHKDLLEFIVSYKDSKGRTNESEAIRMLMQTGYNILNNKPPEQLAEYTEHKENKDDNVNIDNLKKELTDEILLTVYQNKQSEQNKIDIESIKKELLSEIFLQINNQTFNNLNNIIDKLNNLSPTVVTQPQEQKFTKVNAENQEQKPKQKIDIPSNTNPLLANILANSQR